MITVKENTTLVGISELRTNFKRVMELLGTSVVLLERRNKPVAAIVPLDKFEEMEKALEQIEDLGLGYLAAEREARSKASDYIKLEEAERKAKKK